MNDLIQNAMLGALVADAVSMPVHWYYDTHALDRDYSDLETYQAPRNPHPDSILWRSKYTARNKKWEILHDQAQYWGQRGIHYHCARRSKKTRTTLFARGNSIPGPVWKTGLWWGAI